MITSMWIDLAKMGWREVTPSLIILWFSEGLGLKKISLYSGKNRDEVLAKHLVRRNWVDQTKQAWGERKEQRETSGCSLQTETEKQTVWKRVWKLFLTRTQKMASKLCLYTCSRDRECMYTLHLILYFCCGVS